MSALLHNKINRLARVLIDKSSVEFKHNGFYYKVFKSADSGYVVNVYSSDERDEDDEYTEANLIDGGLCSGSAKDALTFLQVS